MDKLKCSVCNTMMGNALGDTHKKCMPNPTKTNSEQGGEWEKEFNRRFVSNPLQGSVDLGLFLRKKHPLTNDIKDFISQLLAQQQSVLLEKVKELVNNITCAGHTIPTNKCLTIREDLKPFLDSLIDKK